MEGESEIRICNADDAYHACAWCIEQYKGTEDVPQKIANTMFPLLTVNDVCKTAASVLKKLAGRRMFLSDGSAEDDNKEASRFLMKKGIADVSRKTLEGGNLVKAIAICEKLANLSGD